MSSIEPVRKEVVVAASAERAFRVFTAGMDRWWPREHHVGASPMARAVVEPRPGGRWYSVCVDGSECDVGRVLAWEPPRRLLLAWQLAAGWQYDASFVTEVEVNFVAEGPKQTRVTLEHRNLERYGEAVHDLRKSIDAPGGWAMSLAAFGRAAEAEPKHFLLRLLPPRPSFAADMSEAERRVMQEHVRYWSGLTERGLVIVFGPVMDPRGAWGLGVVEVESEVEVRALIADDPVNRAGLGSYEVHPLRVGMMRTG